jgi:Cu-Zn family superoxide dismutase
MNWRTVISLMILMLLVQNASYAKTHTLTSKVINNAGKTIGEIHLSARPEGVKIVIELSRISPGVHAIHFHEKGICEPPNFKTAGGHFNPYGKEHGFLNPRGVHAGDLPNIIANEKGIVKATILSKKLTLEQGNFNSIIRPEGTSIIIHAREDDYITDAARYSGNRIACSNII